MVKAEQKVTDIFQDEEAEQFKKENSDYLSLSPLLNDIEIQFKLPIKVNSDKESQQDIIDYLDKTKRKFKFKLDRPNANQLIASNNENQFEVALDHLFGDKEDEKSAFRVYHYLVLMYRRMVTVTINNEPIDVDLRDVHQLGRIYPKMFKDFKSAPSGIVDRIQLPLETFTSEGRKYEFNII